VVRAPVLAAAAEASQPACPPPITTTSTGGLHGMLAIVLRSQVHVGMFLTWHRCGLRQWPARAGRLPQTALEARGPRVCVLLLIRRALCVAVWPAQRSSKVHEGESWESLERDSGSGCGEEMETGGSLASCNNHCNTNNLNSARGVSNRTQWRNEHPAAANLISSTQYEHSHGPSTHLLMNRKHPKFMFAQNNMMSQ
jgi:hypothetical protein